MASHHKSKTYRKKYCAMLIDHMSNGYSYESFGAKADCGRRTLYAWEKEFPEWVEAKEKGLEKCCEFWEGLGLKHIATGKMDKKLNSAVWIFNMKNRFNWRDKQEITGEDGGPIKVEKLGDMSDEDLEELIKKKLRS